MQEIVLYESIRNITYIIYGLYSKLIKLESEGKSSSLEYEDTLRKLEKYEILENKYYEEVEKRTNNNTDFAVLMNARAHHNAKSNFPLYKRIGDIVHIVFHDFDQDDLVYMRMSNRLYEIFIHAKTEEDDFEREIYGFEDIRNKYLIDIIDSMIKDEKFKSYNKILIAAKYKISFINKRRIPIITHKNSMASMSCGVINTTEISEYAEKIFRLTNESLNSEKNSRSLLIASALIRADMLQMDEISFEAMRMMIDAGKIIGRIESNDGEKFFDSIVELKDDDKKKFGDNGHNLERKY